MLLAFQPQVTTAPLAHLPGGKTMSYVAPTKASGLALLGTRWMVECTSMAGRTITVTFLKELK